VPTPNGAGDIPRYFEITADMLTSTARPAVSSDPAERTHILDLAEQVLEQTVTWARAYPIMGRHTDQHSRMAFVALCSAYADPDASVERIFHSSILRLSIFAFDDVMDGVFHDRDYPDLETFAEHCNAAWTGHRPSSPPPTRPEERNILACHRDIASRVADYPAHRWAHQHLATHWDRYCDASLQESRWRLGLEPMPDIEQFLATTTVCVAVGVLTSAELAMTELPQLDSADLAACDKAANLASIATRLYNDLRSIAREQLSGAHNTISRHIDAGATLGEAVLTVQTMGERARDDLATAVAQLPEPLTDLGRSLLRRTQFACDWYLSGEMHGFTGDDLKKLRALPGSSTRPNSSGLQDS
jgi:hypothetical protein